MSFRICTIGCGIHSSSYHGPSYKKYAELNPDVVLAACCDINEEKARNFQMEFGFEKYYTDLNDMLYNEKPDAVCLIAPVEFTADLASFILEQGYPLILEKPPGRSKEEVLKLVEIADRKSIPNRVAFNRRFTPLVRELKRLLDEGLQPEGIHSINCEMFRVDRRDSDFSTTAIHAIDLVRFLAGSDYRNIRFSYQELPHIGPGVANIFMSCTFISGATACFNISPVCGVSIERVTVNTQDNTFFLHTPFWSQYDHPGKLVHLMKNQVIVDATGKEVSDGDDAFEYMGFYYENASFFDDIRAGRKPVCDLKSTVQSVEVAECIRNRMPEYRNESL